MSGRIDDRNFLDVPGIGAVAGLRLHDDLVVVVLHGEVIDVVRGERILERRIGVLRRNAEKFGLRTVEREAKLHRVRAEARHGGTHRARLRELVGDALSGTGKF